MATQSRRITREFPDEVVSLKQFLRLPEIKPALGFLGGRIIQEVSLTLPHSLLDQGLLIRIDALAKPRRLGQVLPELRCTFGGESLVPDLTSSDKTPWHRFCARDSVVLLLHGDHYHGQCPHAG